MIPRPLKPQWFQILLALSGKDLHGYAIQRAVLEQTDDQMRLWPAMLYRSLTKLEEGELIRAAEPPEDEPEDEVALHSTAAMVREIANTYPGSELMDRWTWFQSGLNTDGAAGELPRDAGIVEGVAAARRHRGEIVRLSPVERLVEVDRADVRLRRRDRECYSISVPCSERGRGHDACAHDH